MKYLISLHRQGFGVGQARHFIFDFVQTCFQTTDFTISAFELQVGEAACSENIFPLQIYLLRISSIIQQENVHVSLMAISLNSFHVWQSRSF